MQVAAGCAEFIEAIVDIAAAIERSLRGGGKVMLAGNGGSAGDAQHIAGEFVSRLNFDRAPLPAIALTTDTSVLTAVGNDYGVREGVRAAGPRHRQEGRHLRRHLHLRSLA